jgi:hypothetical protein
MRRRDGLGAPAGLWLGRYRNRTRLVRTTSDINAIAAERFHDAVIGANDKALTDAPQFDDESNTFCRLLHNCGMQGRNVSV